MSNTFLTTSLVVRDASILLQDNMVLANLVARTREADFAQKVGDSIEIKVVPRQTARDFIDDGSTTDIDIVETSVSLQLTEQPYISHTLTTSDKTLSLDDFATVVTAPAVLGIRDAIDEFILSVGTRGFAVNVAGTAGNDPSTIAHIVAGRKILQDNGCPLALRRGILNTTSEASYLQVDQFTSNDFGVPSETATGLKEAILTRRYGIDWFVDQNSGSITLGTTGQATVTDGAATTSASVIDLDEGTGSSTGTLLRGAQFVVAGDAGATVYTLTADISVSGGSYACPVSPVVTAATNAAGDGAGVTFQTALKESIIFHRDALSAAIVPPAPLAVNSSIFNVDNIGLRVTMSSSTSSLSDQIVYDTLLGAQVIQTGGGVVFQG